MASLPAIRWDQQTLEAALREPGTHLRRLYDQYGPLVAVDVEGAAVLFAFHPAQLQQVLGDPDLFVLTDDDGPAGHPEFAGTAVARLSHGILAMSGETHRQHRRMIAPAFTPESAGRYRSAVAEIAARCVAAWRDGEVRDLLAEMRRLVLALAMRTLFGLDAGAHQFPELAGLLEGYASALFGDRPAHRVIEAAQNLESALLHLVGQRRANGSVGDDALAPLIHAASQGILPDQEVAAHAVTLFIAGHWSTAGAAAWVLALLAREPGVEAAVRAELAAIPERGAPAGPQGRGSITLEGAVKETLRLYPPGTWGRRVTSLACHLGTIPLAAGTAVYYSPEVTHRLPELYPDPDTFRPQRWRTERPAQWAYLPFGAGPRRCIGEHLAQMEIAGVVAAVLRRWRLRLPDGYVMTRGRRDPAWPDHDIPVALERV
jgi:cytochrome P450